MNKFLDRIDDLRGKPRAVRQRVALLLSFLFLVATGLLWYATLDLSKPEVTRKEGQTIEEIKTTFVEDVRSEMDNFGTVFESIDALKQQ